MHRISFIIIAFIITLVLCHQSASEVSSIKSELTKNKELGGIRIKGDASRIQWIPTINHKNDSQAQNLERHSLVVGSDKKQYLIRTERRSSKKYDTPAVKRAHGDDYSHSLESEDEIETSSPKDADGETNRRIHFSAQSAANDDDSESESPDSSYDSEEENEEEETSSDSSDESKEVCPDGTSLGSTCKNVFTICHKIAGNPVCESKRCGEPGTHRMMGICRYGRMCLVGKFGKGKCIMPVGPWGPCRTISIQDSHCERTRTRICLGCRTLNKQSCDTGKFDWGPWGSCGDGCKKTREQIFHCRRDRPKSSTDCVEGQDYNYTKWGRWSSCDCSEKKRTRYRKAEPASCKIRGGLEDKKKCDCDPPRWNWSFL